MKLIRIKFIFRGATVSKAFLINEDGDVICSAEGPSTNIWVRAIIRLTCDFCMSNTHM